MRMPDRIGRGVSLVALPNDYTVVDLETTGLSPYCDEIIECAAIRVRDGRATAEFQSLIHPSFPVSGFITELTGITNEMLDGQPSIDEVLPRFLEFIGYDIVLGHNVGFDVNFIYDDVDRVLGKAFGNNFVNTIRVAKKAIPGLAHYRLSDICNHYGIDIGTAHRALIDCRMTHDVYQRMRLQFSSESAFQNLFERKPAGIVPYAKLDARMIAAQVPAEEIDRSNPLFGKQVVFTGTLEAFRRREAMQIVANLGGINANSVTRTTDYLIVGNNEYCTSIRDGKSAKQKKAERYVLEGTGIAILDETTFYDLIKSLRDLTEIIGKRSLAGRIVHRSKSLIHKNAHVLQVFRIGVLVV